MKQLMVRTHCQYNHKIILKLAVALQFNPVAVKKLAERKDVIYQTLIK
jgi:hypothetical protein